MCELPGGAMPGGTGIIPGGANNPGPIGRIKLILNANKKCNY